MWCSEGCQETDTTGWTTVEGTDLTARNDMIIALWLGGESKAAIGRRFDISYQRVQQVLRARGVLQARTQEIGA